MGPPQFGDWHQPSSPGLVIRSQPHVALDGVFEDAREQPQAHTRNNPDAARASIWHDKQKERKNITAVSVGSGVVKDLKA